MQISLSKECLRPSPHSRQLPQRPPDHQRPSSCILSVNILGLPGRHTHRDLEQGPSCSGPQRPHLYMGEQTSFRLLTGLAAATSGSPYLPRPTIPVRHTGLSHAGVPIFAPQL